MQKNHLINSNYTEGKHNLFLCPLVKKTIKEKNEYDLDKYQKVYRYLNIRNLFQKNSLYKYYSLMKQKFCDDFNYMPETYNYPEEKGIINDKFTNYKLNLNDLWLIKPVNKCGGYGIDILTSLKFAKLKNFIITKYITNLHLINEKKYDLRMFILISGLKPLRIYFFKEGLVRIASEKYSLNTKNINNKFVHLTNRGINKLNKNYHFPNGLNDIKANAWNILTYKKYLSSLNIHWENIREKIKDIIIKSIISVYKNLTEENEINNLNDQNFYEILGYDILITNNFIPKLIEINTNPDMKIYTNLDKSIKADLFTDTINLVGIIPYSRKKKNLLKNQDNFQNIIDDNINNALCELERPRGNYELIFPIKKTIHKYKKYFLNNSVENKIFWNKIK